MKIKFKNLGPLKKGEVTIRNMTIFCGKNNTGKTYVNYLIYSILETLKDYRTNLNLNIDQLFKEGVQEIDVVSLFDNNFDRIIKEIANEVKENLYKVFNSKKDFFEELELEIELDKEQKREKLIKLKFDRNVTIGENKVKISNLNKVEGSNKITLIYFKEKTEKKILEESLRRYIENFLQLCLIQEENQKYMLPTERNGLNIFYNELLRKRANIVENMDFSVEGKEEIENVNNYPKPVKDYLRILTELDRYDKNEGNEIFVNIAKEMEKEIIRGKYKIDNNRIFYQTENEKELDLYIASSTVKTIFGIIFYLRHLIKNKDYLIIDEPELNLHPENQVKIAKLLARLVNSGIKVIISTHSDYITKEFNNLLMLDNNFKNKTKIMEKYDYSKEDVLERKNMGAYLFKDGILDEMEIGEEGIITKTFDEVIESINERNDDIYYSIKESGDK